MSKRPLMLWSQLYHGDHPPSSGRLHRKATTKSGRNFQNWPLASRVVAKNAKRPLLRLSGRAHASAIRPHNTSTHCGRVGSGVQGKGRIHAADAACPSAATGDLSPRLLVTVPHALRRLRCMSAQAAGVCCDAWVHTHRACKHVLRIGRTSRPAYKDCTQNVFTVLQSRSSGPHRSALLSAGCHVWRCIARNFHDSTPFSRRYRVQTL